MSNSWLDGDTASDFFFLLFGMGGVITSLQVLPKPIGYVGLAASSVVACYPFKRLYEDYSRIPEERKLHKNLRKKVKETYLKMIRI